ncbi:MAG: hypothetical protein MJY82_11055, partial [Fibrobacter sp.]|nr:hypothetical protein [Fibrobacter sp.]
MRPLARPHFFHAGSRSRLRRRFISAATAHGDGRSDGRSLCARFAITLCSLRFQLFSHGLRER